MYEYSTYAQFSDKVLCCAELQDISCLRADTWKGTTIRKKKGWSNVTSSFEKSSSSYINQIRSLPKSDKRWNHQWLSAFAILFHAIPNLNSGFQF